MAKFGIEGVGINTIILFFSDKYLENIMYLSLKAVQWFTICGTSPPIVNLHGGDVPPIVNHCTAFNDRYTMFF